MKLRSSHEVNFDGIVGPTHNYSGLSFGNVASVNHRAGVSNPKEAALQGLTKMKTLLDWGLRQAVLPPHERPNLERLRRLGFSGTDEKVIADAVSKAPEVFRSVCSASAMWTANAATVAPSSDTTDGKVHFTPANLNNKFHRSFEHLTTAKILQTIFSNPDHFVHHDTLPEGNWFGDEGAANHTRLCQEQAGKGLHFFVFGCFAFGSGSEPKKFPARQSYEASEALARLHKLSSEQVVFAQQNPEIIDAGVFHNDVGAVGNENLYLCHEMSYVNQEKVLEELRRKFERVTGGPLKLISVSSQAVPIPDVIRSYLFNSQVVTLASGKMAILAPQDCREVASARSFLESVEADPTNAVSQIRYFDLRQSMQNGGGPACLRLRVVLSQEESQKMLPSVVLSDALFFRLTEWVKKHYRDRLAPEDLADPKLLKEGRTALDELTQLLGLGSVYGFQK